MSKLAVATVVLLSTFMMSISSFAAASEADKEAQKPRVSEPASDKILVPKGRYITGGVIASTIGFGIGHVIQGRFQSKGWIFTATEVVGIALLSTSGCSSDRRERLRSSNAGDCDDGSKAALGAMTWLGFHVWEIVDSWVGARPYSEPSNVSAMILPATDGSKLVFAMRF